MENASNNSHAAKPYLSEQAKKAERQPFVLTKETTHAEDLPSPETRQVEWGIHWRSPTTMILLFLTGVATAIGHHLYYQSMDGKQVSEVKGSQWSTNAFRNSQEWRIRFGTALAFATKTMFSAAVAFAYNQHIWSNIRRKSMSIAGLDAMFGAVNDIFAFLTFDYVINAKLGALLAVITWLIPLSALITPATLAVVPSTSSFHQNMSVPAIDFLNVSPLYSALTNNVNTDSITSTNGVTPYLTRIISTTASGLKILPMKAIASNATYSVTFNGPSFRCASPSAVVEAKIHQVVNATEKQVNSGPYINTIDDTRVAWLAFAPTNALMPEAVPPSAVDPLYQSIVELCITGPNIWAPVEFEREQNVQCEGIVNDTSGYNHGQIWIWTQAQTYNCVLQDTEYNVKFSSSGDGQQIIDPSYSFRWTQNDISNLGGYYAIANGLVNWVTGAIVMRPDLGFMAYKTRMTESALFGALKEAPISDTFSDTKSDLPFGSTSSEIRAAARNLSMGSLLEELSRNLTLSLFSANQIMSPHGLSTNVTTTRLINVYTYSKTNLIFTYAVTFGLAFLGVFVGSLAYIQNGVSYTNSFSTILATTRNKRLDQLTKGSSLGAMPLRESLAKTRLKFGLLQSEERNELARPGFGLANQVLPLTRGTECC